ncbi:hypothetical protein EK21DRAFT_15407, partial [Setomelanomma holmii]
MLLPRILAPVRASIQASAKLAAPSKQVLEALRAVNASSTPTPAPTVTLSFVRHASHQSQGRANGAKDGPGKRLGAKKSGGNIIFRQRGTSWFPGENCKFGRDHCIFATESGYVRYYKDPRKHPKRQYIGVALEKEHVLPYSPNAPRHRRLNMVAVDEEVVEEGGQVLIASGSAAGEGKKAALEGRENRVLSMSKKGYAFREANWQIGRAAERANVQVKEFVPGDRWAAWRKSQARIAANEEKRRLRNSSKKGGKAKK